MPPYQEVPCRAVANIGISACHCSLPLILVVVALLWAPTAVPVAGSTATGGVPADAAAAAVPPLQPALARSLRFGRRLTMMGATAAGAIPQGCVLTAPGSPLPSTTALTWAQGWDITTCGPWFDDADGDRYQPCYLTCAPGTYADASTEYSQSSFWCAQTYAPAVVGCIYNGVADAWHCPDCASAANHSALGCFESGDLCRPSNDQCGSTAVGGVPTPARSSWFSPIAGNYDYLRCMPCVPPLPHPSLFVNATPYALVQHPVTLRPTQVTYR